MNRRAFCAVMAGAAAACSRRGRAPLAELAPPDSTLLVGARLAALRNTETYRRHFAGASFPALDRFARESNVQVDRDIDDVLYASNGRDFVVLARGRLPKQGGIAFLADDTGVAGSTQMVESVARHASSPGAPDALAAPMRDVGADAQFWAVFAGGAARLPVPDSSNLGNVNTILRTVSAGSFAADLSSGLKARARVLCTADTEARNMGDALKALLAIGKASSAGKPGVARAYDAIRVAVEGRYVTAAADVGQDLVEKVVEAFGR